MDDGIGITAIAFKVGGLNFNNLVWNTPELDPPSTASPGTASASGSGHVASAASSMPSGYNLDFIAEAVLTGQLNYSGPAVSGNAHLVVTSSGGASNSNVGVEVDQDGNDVGSLTVFAADAGTYDVPISLRGTSGSVISVNVSSSCYTDSVEGPVNTAVTVTFTPAF